MLYPKKAGKDELVNKNIFDQARFELNMRHKNFEEWKS